MPSGCACRNPPTLPTSPRTPKLPHAEEQPYSRTRSRQGAGKPPWKTDSTGPNGQGHRGQTFWRGPSPFRFVTVPEHRCYDLARVAGEVSYGRGMIP